MDLILILILGELLAIHQQTSNILNNNRKQARTSSDNKNTTALKILTATRRHSTVI
jgi:hypothetical protein